MSEDWSRYTLRDFQAALASSSPTPGGGTAAAVALGQSAALTCMVCDLTTGSEKWETGWEAAESAQNIAVPLINRCMELATEDSDAFDEVMASFRLARDSAEEIENRREQIRSATLVAAVVPLITAKMALALLETLPALAEFGNANAVSDVGVAALLAGASCKGALMNVQINLGSIPTDMGEKERLESAEIAGAVDSIMENCLDTVAKRLS